MASSMGDAVVKYYLQELPQSVPVVLASRFKTGTVFLFNSMKPAKESISSTMPACQ